MPISFLNAKRWKKFIWKYKNSKQVHDKGWIEKVKPRRQQTLHKIGDRDRGSNREGNADVLVIIFHCKGADAKFDNVFWGLIGLQGPV